MDALDGARSDGEDAQAAAAKAELSESAAAAAEGAISGTFCPAQRSIDGEACATAAGLAALNTAEMRCLRQQGIVSYDPERYTHRPSVSSQCSDS